MLIGYEHNGIYYYTKTKEKTIKIGHAFLIKKAIKNIFLTSASIKQNCFSFEIIENKENKDIITLKSGHIMYYNVPKEDMVFVENKFLF